MIKTSKRISVIASAALAAMLASPAPAFALVDGDELGGLSVETYPADIKDNLPKLAARSWAIADADGNILYSRNGEMPVKIASVTKTMTAIVAVDYPLDTSITVSEHAASIPGSSAEVQPGDVLTLAELLEGLMLPSGNDAAYAIAEGLGEKMLEADGVEGAASRSPEEKAARFVAAMNAKAAELGLRDSLFVNPCGLDDEGFEGDHHSCAVDVALMARAAMSNPELARICDSSRADMDAVRAGQPASTPLANTNLLLDQRPAEAAGVKTGFTDAAGSCLAGCGIIDGDCYYTAALGCEEAQDAADVTAALWDWVRISRLDMDYMTGYEKTPEGDWLVGELPAREWSDKTFRIVAKGSAEMSKWYWEDDFELVRHVEEPDGEIHKGDVVGSLDVVDGNGQVVHHMDVVAAESVESPGFWEGVGIFFARFFSPFTGSPIVAESRYYEGTGPSVTGVHYAPPAS